MKDLMEVLEALENNCGTFESIIVYAQNLTGLPLYDPVLQSATILLFIIFLFYFFYRRKLENKLVNW